MRYSTKRQREAESVYTLEWVSYDFWEKWSGERVRETYRHSMPFASQIDAEDYFFGIAVYSYDIDEARIVRHEPSIDGATMIPTCVREYGASRIRPKASFVGYW